MATKGMTMAQILDGKALAAKIRGELAAEVGRWTAAGHRPPKLVAVLVGDDPASQVYVGSKTRGCAEVGMESETLRLPAEIGEAALLEQVRRLNGDDGVDGILVQLPLPDDIAERRIIEAVVPEKDVDGFHPVNVGRLWSGQDALAPATPSGIVEMLRRAGVEMSGRHAVIVGRSNIVGKPMAALLLREHATVTLCHSRTSDLPAVCRSADILIAAVGRPAMLTDEYVRQGATVIDVGINRVSDPQEVERLFPGDDQRRATLERRGSILVGDVDFQRVSALASAITPVPGGVGPLTVAQVLVNTLTAARRRRGEP